MGSSCLRCWGAYASSMPRPLPPPTHDVFNSFTIAIVIKHSVLRSFASPLRLHVLPRRSRSCPRPLVIPLTSPGLSTPAYPWSPSPRSLLSAHPTLGRQHRPLNPSFPPLHLVPRFSPLPRALYQLRIYPACALDRLRGLAIGSLSLRFPRRAIFSRFEPRSSLCRAAPTRVCP